MTHNPIAVVDRDSSEEAWRNARARGCTATDVHRLATGGISTRLSILDEKINGSTFTGNAHTRRGHEREAIIGEWIHRRFGIAPNSILWAHPERPEHMATPDGLGKREGFEIKSTVNDWINDGIPVEHIDQVQWNLYVTGRERWLFVWEQLDEDGQPPLEPEFRWIDRDEARIADLVAAADRFLAWRDAGAPLVDADIPEVIDEAISQHVAARKIKAQWETLEKKAEATIRAWIAERPGLAAIGYDASGHDGGVLFKVTPRAELDTEAWEQGDERTFKRAQSLRRQLARLEAEALEQFSRPGKPSTRLTISAHKEQPKGIAA